MSNSDIWAVNAIATAADARQSRGRQLVSQAIYDARSFNRAVPDGATSFSRPGESWQDSCYCEMANGEMAGHVCPAASAAVVGERARALIVAATGGQQDDDAEAATSGSELALAGGSAFALADQAEDARRLAHMARRMGLDVDEDAPPATERGRKYHGRHGRPVTTRTRAHASELDEDPTNAGAPRHGNRPHPGVKGGIYESSLGGPEEIAQRHPGLFKGR